MENILNKNIRLYSLTAVRWMAFAALGAILTLAATLAGGANAQDAARPKQRVSIGALALDYDVRLWRPSTVAGTGDSLSLEFLSSGPRPLGIEVAITITNNAICTPAAMTDRAASSSAGLNYAYGWTPRTAATLHAGTLAVHYATLSSPCRNLVGSPVYACVAHGGATYMIDTYGGITCMQSPALDRSILALLAGLSVEARE
jgi:hypothetical protein